MLSVVLATFNEEKNIAACLDSVKELADEIVVVDGGSTDKTVAIAKKYGAQTLITDNPAIFHINKQKAIERASGDWILQLDADERVTPELSGEIKSKIQSASQGTKPEINGYWMPRKNWFLGKFLMKGGQYPDYTLRLYRRGKGRLPCKTVHEQAVVDGEVDYLKNPLVHMADTSSSRYLRRWSRYTDLMADELADNKPSWFSSFDYLFFKPLWWFLVAFFRHKGFVDGWQGFIFSLFSSLRFPMGYLKFLKTQVIGRRKK